MKIFNHKNSNKLLSDECLSDLQLTSLLEGNLKAKEKRSYIRHINRCNDCRFCWMEASSYLVSPVPSPTKELPLNGWLKIFTVFPKPISLVSGLAVITLILVMITIQQPLSQDINTLLNQQYVQLNYDSQAIINKQNIENITLPWEHGVLGFSSTIADSSSLAFAAGLWDGRDELSVQFDAPRPKTLAQPLNNEQKINYQLGRWLTSLWYASQLNENIDSSQQFKILELFNQDLQTNDTATQLNKIQKSLLRLSLILEDVEQQKTSNDQFRKQLETMIAIHSPLSLNKSAE